jgi:hypothetical protein
MQPLPYNEYKSPKPSEERNERSSDNKKNPLLLQIPKDVLLSEEDEQILASVTFIGNL